MSVPARFALTGDDEPSRPPCGMRMIGGGTGKPPWPRGSFSFTTGSGTEAPTSCSGGAPAAGVIFGIAVPAMGVTFGENPAAGAGAADGIPFAGVRRRGTIGAGLSGIAGGGGGAVPISVALPGFCARGGELTLGSVVVALFVVAASGWSAAIGLPGSGAAAAGEGTATSVSVNGEGGELARTTGGGGALGAVVFALGVIGLVAGTGGGLLGAGAASTLGDVCAALGREPQVVTPAVFASGGAWLPAAGGAMPIAV